ncbi:MAG: extracellular solute-binding protein [Parcubacteria group bacterium]|nr:extracellular solute-binding protein [Parcubacteria group bacterium]MBI3074673.1 extracellular solute-binding protein [Parcubacteria group bacterium]
MNLFQTGLLIVFSFFIVFAVLVFSGILPFFNATPDGVGGEVVLWGTLPAAGIAAPLEELNRANEDVFSVRYVEKKAATFDTELVEALASGTGPDMILLPHELIVRHENKVFPIPYASFSARAFRDSFVEEGELYLRDDGIVALPFSVDPLVMYWNRDIFSDAGRTAPPAEWSEFLTLAPSITKKDAVLNIRQSVIAFGDFLNVRNAKDILSMLILQAGNPIVEKEGSARRVTLRENRGFATPPSESALRFYTEFANPSKPIYSWNRSLPDSRDMFAAGDLAVYFGYAGERGALAIQSPRLNFDVAMAPQTKDAARKATFGKMLGVAVLKNSRNAQTAFYAAFALTGKPFLDSFGKTSGLPPVRRDLLAQKPRNADAFTSVFYDSALISRAWLDPQPAETSRIFDAAVRNVLSGRSTVGSAVSEMHEAIVQLF